MGDHFSGIGSGAIIVNRSVVNAAINNVGRSYSGVDSSTLLEILSTVEKSGNTAAMTRLEVFMDQLSSPKPEKSFLRSLWQDITALVPLLNQLPAVVAFIKNVIDT